MLKNAFARKLVDLDQKVLEKEQGLLYFADLLWSTDTPTNGTITVQPISFFGRIWNKVRAGYYVKIEWPIRNGLAAFISVVFALEVLPPGGGPYINPYVMAVLAVVYAKPTLGEALDGTWIAIGGAIVCGTLALILMPLACLHGAVSALSCQFVHTIIMVFFLGDTVQVSMARHSGTCGDGKGPGLFCARFGMRTSRCGSA